MKEQKKSRISKLKVGIATVAVAALLVIPASAQDTEDMSVEITGGDLTVELTEETGLGDAEGQIAYSHEAQNTEGAVTVGVNDERGTDDGWGVTLEATDFSGGTEGNEIAATNFEITDQGEVSDASGLDNESDVDQTDFSTTPSDLATAVQIASAASGGGSGDFSWVSELNLNVPAGQNADTYSSTVTLTSTEAP